MSLQGGHRRWPPRPTLRLWSSRDGRWHSQAPHAERTAGRAVHPLVRNDRARCVRRWKVFTKEAFGPAQKCEGVAVELPVVQKLVGARGTAESCNPQHALRILGPYPFRSANNTTAARSSRSPWIKPAQQFRRITCSWIFRRWRRIASSRYERSRSDRDRRPSSPGQVRFPTVAVRAGVPATRGGIRPVTSPGWYCPPDAKLSHGDCRVDAAPPERLPRQPSTQWRRTCSIVGNDRFRSARS